VPPLADVTRAAIDRLKIKVAGATQVDLEALSLEERVQVVKAQAENNAIGEKMIKEREDSMNGAPTVDAMLLPDGINSVFQGAPDKFDITISRFQLSLKTAECYLDDTRPMLFNSKYKVPERISPCSVRTGRYCPEKSSCACCAFCDPCREGKRKSALTSFGPGVSSYFKWIKGVAVLCCFMTLGAAPIMWLSSLGTAYVNEDASVGVLLAGVSLGALGGAHNATGFIKPTAPAASWGNMNITWFVVGCDFVLALAFLLAWSCFFVIAEKEDLDTIVKNRITADEYSVEFFNFPDNVKASDVMEWINTQLLTREEKRCLRVVVALDLSKYLSISRARQAIASRIESIEAELARLYVTARAVAVNDSREIGRLKKLIDKLESIKSRALKDAKSKKKAALKQLDVAQETLEPGAIALAQMEINAADAALAEANALPDETEETARYTKTANIRTREGHISILEFDIERFGTSPADQRLRSAAVHLWELRRSLLKRAADVGERLRIVLKSPHVVKAWATFASIDLARSVLQRMSFTQLDRLCCLTTVPRWRRLRGTYVVHARSAPIPSSIVWENLNSEGGWLRWTYALAQCNARYLFSTFLKDLKSRLSSLVIIAIAACSVVISLTTFFLATTLRSMGSLSIIAEIPTPLLFAILQIVTSILVRYSTRHCERHQTRDALEYATFVKLYFLYLANAALVLCLFTADFSYLISSFSSFTALLGNLTTAFGGRTLFTDFSPAWHASVGSTLVLFQILNLALPQAELCACALRISCLRCCVRNNCAKVSSQRALNLSMRGPRFALEDRAAHLLAALTVTMLFCTGVPLLVPICALVFFVSYWSELWGFANLYLEPPYMSSVVSKTIIAIMPIILIAHCLFAAQFLTGPSLTIPSRPTIAIGQLKNSGSFLDTVYRRGVLDTTLLSIAVISICLGVMFKAQILATFRIVTCLSDTRICGSSRLHAILIVPPKKEADLTVFETQEARARDHLRQNYRDAFRTQFILDIPSFDIADNPAYFSAFGEIRASRKYVDYVEPDPGLPERVIPSFTQDPEWESRPFTRKLTQEEKLIHEKGMAAAAKKPSIVESSVLRQTFKANSFSNVMQFVPQESDRIALYGAGGGLKSTEAVILKPKKVPDIGEGRHGLLFKRLSRIHVIDDLHERDRGSEIEDKLRK
jgi:hypothetical protein